LLLYGTKTTRKYGSLVGDCAGRHIGSRRLRSLPKIHTDVEQLYTDIHLTISYLGESDLQGQKMLD
jgi:hypothetical protein